MIDTPGTTGTEKALAVTVNILVWRSLVEAVGGKGWAGALIAAFGMSVAADPSSPPILGKLGGIISAPGAVTVSIIRDGGTLGAQADAASSSSKTPGDVIDVDFGRKKE